MAKPLFIPLKTEYYRDFENGTKTTEYRLHGPRWNRRTCTIGRPVTLSLGYGKRERLHGTVTGFIDDPLGCLPSYVGRELRALYGEKVDTLTLIACIEIALAEAP